MSWTKLLERRFVHPRATILSDVPCLACGHNLRGLRAGGRCPECGRPILDTVAPSDSHAQTSARLDSVAWTLLAPLLLVLPVLVLGPKAVVVAVPCYVLVAAIRAIHLCRLARLASGGGGQWLGRSLGPLGLAGFVDLGIGLLALAAMFVVEVLWRLPGGMLGPAALGSLACLGSGAIVGVAVGVSTRRVARRLEHEALARVGAAAIVAALLPPVLTLAALRALSPGTAPWFLGLLGIAVALLASCGIAAYALAAASGQLRRHEPGSEIEFDRPLATGMELARADRE